MEPLVLKDMDIEPTEALIFSIIGKNQEHWKNLINGVKQKFPGAEGLWRYYNDGKNWLFKMERKKKTLFWVGILADSFRATFYFGDKAEPLIEKSGLPEGMIADFKAGKRYGNLRAISIKMLQPEDVDHALILAEIKSKLK